MHFGYPFTIIKIQFGRIVGVFRKNDENINFWWQSEDCRTSVAAVVIFKPSRVFVRRSVRPVRVPIK